MKEVNQFFATGPIYNIHDAIIQTLQRDIGYDEFGNPINYPPDIYEAALNTVSNSKVIFSPTGVHPDAYLYEQDQEKAVSDVGGRFSGIILQPYIDRTGHPTAKGKLALEPDPEIENLIASGHLSLSPSVWTTYDDYGKIIKIRFQNLIIFPEIPGGAFVPRDSGTIILNSKPNEAKPPVNSTQSTGKPMTTDPTVIEKPVIDPALAAEIKQIKEMAAQFTESKKTSDELKAQLEAKDAELKAEKEAFAQFTAKLEADKQAAREREFQGLINDPLFPPGLLKGDNAEEILKAEFAASPIQFTRRILTVFATQNAFLGEKGKEQGQQFSAPKSESKWDTSEGKTLLEKFGLKREQMGA
jgi:hypothetical protein